MIKRRLQNSRQMQFLKIKILYLQRILRVVGSLSFWLRGRRLRNSLANAKFCKIILVFIILPLFFLSWGVVLVHAESDGIEVELNIVEGCNSNGRCEQYETILGCPEDCAQRTTSSGSKISRPPPPIPIEDIIPPQNPWNVKAIVIASGIILSWLNSPDEDFSYIRIMRNEDHFHSDPFSGKLIYEGNKQYFFDKNVLAGTKYFYTLFSRDTTGNFSSGSAASAIAFYFIKTPTAPALIGNFINSLPQYMVHQYNQKVKPLSYIIPVVVNNTDNITIDTGTINYSDDFLTVVGPAGEDLGQYMFSFNKNSGRYESIIPPLPNTGTYTITIFGYKDNNPEILSKGLLFVSISAIPKIEQIKESFCNTFNSNVILYIGYLLFLLAPLFLLKLIK